MKQLLVISLTMEEGFSNLNQMNQMIILKILKCLTAMVMMLKGKPRKKLNSRLLRMGSYQW
jgi:hypothetical protein